MTTIEFRPIEQYPDYVIGRNRAVCSVPRTRPGKAGSVRALSGRQLKPDTKNRVWLTAEGRRERHSVDRLFRAHFPDVAYRKPQGFCRQGHPLLPYLNDRLASWVEPHVAYWGSGNRVCLYCQPDWIAPPRRAVTPARPYWCSLPMLRDGERTIGVRRERQNVGRVRENARRIDADDEGDAGAAKSLLPAGHGYGEETFSRTDHTPFPTVCLVPDHLRGLDAMIRRAP